MVSYALAGLRKDTTMGKVKYSEEMKLQTVKYVLEGGKSATKISKELGIDTTILAKNSFSLCSKALFCYAKKMTQMQEKSCICGENMLQ